MRAAEIDYLEGITHVRWTGLRLAEQTGSDRLWCATLCQAIDRSFSQRFSLPASGLECPGALRCLGFSVDEGKMAAHIAAESAGDIDSIRSIIADAPHLDRTVPALVLGDIDLPDLYAGYLRPDGAMQLLRRWQMHYGAALGTRLSSFMAICSAVVAAYTNGALVFSMGCPESRKKGGIAPDRLMAVLPRALANEMMKEVPVCRRMNTSAPSAASGLSGFRT